LRKTTEVILLKSQKRYNVQDNFSQKQLLNLINFFYISFFFAIAKIFGGKIGVFLYDYTI